MTGQGKIRFSMVLLILTALGLIFYTLFYPLQAMENIRRSLSVFAVSVLPSLAVFSVCTKILIKSGWIGKFSALPLVDRFHFLGISPSGMAAFVFGAFAGFPMGASILAELYQNGEISAEEAASILPFCNQAGASFVIGTVGMLLFDDVRYGWILFFAQTGAALTGLLLTAFLRKNSGRYTLCQRKTASPFAVMTASVSETAYAMVCVCGFIVFFALCGDVIFRLCTILPFVLPAWGISLLGGFLEISSGITALSVLGLSVPMRFLLSGILLGFGGFCVFLQAIDRTENFFYSPKQYFSGKLLTAVLCPVFALLLFLLIG